MPVQVKCLTLFVTHYPLLGELETKHPGAVGNFHMAYVEAEEFSELELDQEVITCVLSVEEMQSNNHCAD